MNKSDLIRAIERQADVTPAIARTSMEFVLYLLKSALRQGEGVQIAGFGRFSVRHKSARPARNPRTGELVIVSGRRVVRFKPSLALREDVQIPETPLSSVHGS